MRFFLLILWDLHILNCWFFNKHYISFFNEICNRTLSKRSFKYKLENVFTWKNKRQFFKHLAECTDSIKVSLKLMFLHGIIYCCKLILCFSIHISIFREMNKVIALLTLSCCSFYWFNFCAQFQYNYYVFLLLNWQY